MNCIDFRMKVLDSIKSERAIILAYGRALERHGRDFETHNGQSCVISGL